MKLHSTQGLGIEPAEGGTFAGGGGGGAAGHQLASLLDLLRRRAGLILAAVAAGTAIFVLLGLRAPTLYTAKTLVEIRRQAPEPVPGEPAAERPEPVDLALVRAEMKILGSQDHARRVIDALGLERDPEFLPGPPSALGQVAARVLGAANALWPLSGAGDEEEEAPPAAAPSTAAATRRLFRERLAVAQDDESRVVAISFTSADPAKAALVADAVADLYLRGQVDEKRADAARTAAWLRQRLLSLRGEVEHSEAAAQAYRAANGLAPAGDTDVVDQQVADINRELVAARGELAQRQADLAFARELRGRGGSGESLPGAMGSVTVAELRRQEAELVRSEAELALTYGERHPRLQLIRAEKQEVLGKIGREVDRVVAGLDGEARTARARVAALEAQLGRVLGARDRNRDAGLRLAELEREAEAGRRLYELFLQRSKEAEQREAIVRPDARIVAAAAAPDAPSTPGLAMFAALGLITSAIGGGVLALLRERLDDRLRGGAQVRALLGLPCIGLVPRLDARGLRGRRPAGELLGTYVEAMRSILAALHLGGSGGPGPRMVLVTSALPSEGRTTLSASLAAYAARLGRRVLLINLDPKRQQGGGAGRAEEVGLVDRLLGDLPFEDLIRRDDALRVDFISSGRQRGDLMSLVLSGQLRDLLWRLGGCYDLVVIDSPPVLGAADARMLAPIVDRVVFVVRAGSTRGRFAQAALQALAEVRADVAGVVLTQAAVPWHLRPSNAANGDGGESRDGGRRRLGARAAPAGATARAPGLSARAREFLASAWRGLGPAFWRTAGLDPASARATRATAE